VAAQPKRLRRASFRKAVVRVRGDLLILTGAILLTALLALSSPQEQQASTFSSYDTGRNGYHALYEVMRRERVPTSRFEGELGTLRRFHGTMILSVNDFGRIVVPNADVERLATIVRGGARLILAGPMLVGSEVLQLPDTFAIPNDSSARALPSNFTKNVGTVAGSFGSAFKLRGGVRELLVTRQRAVAVSYRLGRGTVIAIGAPDVFSNALLGRDQNAWFAWNVLAGSGSILFDERLHGYTAETSIWSVMPQGARDSVWICIAILLAAVVGNAFRSAPPVLLEPKRPRDSSAYVTAMASLLRRARAGAAATARFARDATRLARQRPSLSARPEIRAQLERLEEMTYALRPTDAAVLNAAREYLSLRKELAS
jgi:hypothetical protein